MLIPGNLYKIIVSFMYMTNSAGPMSRETIKAFNKGDLFLLLKVYIKTKNINAVSLLGPDGQLYEIKLEEFQSLLAPN